MSDFVFNLVESDWTVPRPEPGRGDHVAWYSAAYVGLDGYRMDSNDVLGGGTGHDYYKAKNGFYKTSAATVISTCEDGTVCTATIQDNETVIVRYGGARDK
ncbi:hypothetical protein MY1884_009445 [Beauveria asiatica]